jgi:hypothetical protein
MLPPSIGIRTTGPPAAALSEATSARATGASSGVRAAG